MINNGWRLRLAYLRSEELPQWSSLASTT